MACGLPTVTIAARPLTEIVREGQEGLHFARGATPAALAGAHRTAGRTTPTLRARAGPERARARGRALLLGARTAERARGACSRADAGVA